MTSISSWLFANRIALKADFTEYTWPKNYGISLSDFKIEIQMEGLSATGRAQDPDPSLALEKAAAECVERWLCRKLQLHPLAMAVSGDPSSYEHAKNEAAERRLFWTHLNQSIPFDELAEEHEHLRSEMVRLCKYANHVSPTSRLDFAFMRSENSSELGVLAWLTHLDHPISLGLSYGVPSIRLLRRAFNEALVNFVHYLEGNAFDLSMRQQFCVDTRIIQKVSELARSAPNPVALPNARVKELGTAVLHPHKSIDFSKFQLLKSCPIDPVAFFYEAANG